MKQIILILVAAIFLASCSSTIKLQQTETKKQMFENWWFVYKYEGLYGVYSAKSKIQASLQKQFRNEKYFYMDFQCDTILHFGDSIRVKENKRLDIEVIEIKRIAVKNRSYKF